MKEFIRQFRIGEYNDLEKANHALIILISVVILTFLALGHVIGGLDELDKRMNNPYSNWLNIPITIENSINEMKQLESYFTNSDVSQEYKIKGIKSYQIEWFRIFDKSQKKILKYRARSLAQDDPIKEIIYNQNNILYNSNVSDCSLIVSESLLRSLGYKSYEHCEFLLVIDNDIGGKGTVFQFPIAMIVKELPSNVDIIISESFITLLNSNRTDTGFVSLESSNKLYFKSKYKRKIDELQLSIDSTYKVKDRLVTIEQLNGDSIYSATILLDEILDPFARTRFYEKLLNTVSDFTIPVRYECVDVYSPEIDAYYYSMHFNELSEIKRFRNTIKSEFGVEANLADVESKMNFFLVTRLTYLFLFFLSMVSIVGILVFIYQLLQNHFIKIKTSIGTLLAFGLSTTDVQRIYLYIVTKLFVKASIISFIILMVYSFVLQGIGFGSFFTLFDLKIYIFWIFSFLVLLIGSSLLIKSFTSNTPGDLIYERV